MHGQVLLTLVHDLTAKGLELRTCPGSSCRKPGGGSGGREPSHKRPSTMSPRGLEFCPPNGALEFEPAILRNVLLFADVMELA